MSFQLLLVAREYLCEMPLKRHSPDESQPETDSDLISTSVIPTKKKKHNNFEKVSWKEKMISKFDNLASIQTSLESTQTTLVSTVTSLESTQTTLVSTVTTLSDKLSLLGDKVDSILSVVSNLQNGNSWIRIIPFGSRRYSLNSVLKLRKLFPAERCDTLLGILTQKSTARKSAVAWRRDTFLWWSKHRRQDLCPRKLSSTHQAAVWKIWSRRPWSDRFRQSRCEYIANDTDIFSFCFHELTRWLKA